MKKFILSIIVCLGVAATADAQSMLSKIARQSVSQAKSSTEFKAHSIVNQGINSVLSGKLFGKKKDTSKGADEAMVSYLNSELGFKGQYPKSYSRTEEDGQVMFSSSNGNINIVYYGIPETTLDEQYQKVLEEVNSNYELLEQEQKSDNFTVKYNMGGTLVTVHSIVKDSRVAMVMIAYPEDEATSYKKLISNIQKSLQFFK